LLGTFDCTCALVAFSCSPRDLQSSITYIQKT
jgi:hypothetical protein